MMRKINHQLEVSSAVSTYFLNDNLSDITLIVDGKELPGHKFVLGARSNYFRALLYGGMKEAKESVIELHETPLEPFKILLNYIYKGTLDFEEIEKDKDLIASLFTLCHRYGFDDLLNTLCEEAKNLLTVDNVLLVLEAASFQGLSDLETSCIEYIDENAEPFLMNETFKHMLVSDLKDAIQRNTFCAREIKIFEGIQEWLRENPLESNEEILNLIRLPLIDELDLLKKVKPTGLYNQNQITDAIRLQQSGKNMFNQARYTCVPNQNIFKKDIHIRYSNGLARHKIEPYSPGITIQFEKPYKINKIRLKVSASLVDAVLSPYPAYDAYTVKCSLDGTTWKTLIERSQADNIMKFWSERGFYFNPEVITSLKIIGYSRTLNLDKQRNYWFQVKSLECLYTKEEFEFDDQGGLIPKFNIAALPYVDETSKDDYFRANCDIETKYRYHRCIAPGSVIEFNLDTVTQINYIKLLLWDMDRDISYRYTIESSLDDKEWQMIVDTENKPCKSWQEHKIANHKVFFIRIKATDVLYDGFDSGHVSKFFRLVHFECSFKKYNTESS